MARRRATYKTPLLVCNFATSSAASIPVCPGGTGNTTHYTLGDRAFAVAGPRAWNSLAHFITDCPLSISFRKYLKYLFLSTHETTVYD